MRKSDPVAELCLGGYGGHGCKSTHKKRVLLSPGVSRPDKTTALDRIDVVGRLISGTAWEETPAADVDKLKEGAVLGYNMTG